MQGEAALSRTHAAALLKEFAQQGAAKEEPAKESPPEQMHPDLTLRQREILELVAQGRPYKEVAHLLSLSERTIKYHMGEIVQALHLKNRQQVVPYALRTGLTKAADDIPQA